MEITEVGIKGKSVDGISPSIQRSIADIEKNRLSAQEMIEKQKKELEDMKARKEEQKRAMLAQQRELDTRIFEAKKKLEAEERSAWGKTEAARLEKEGQVEYSGAVKAQSKAIEAKAQAEKYKSAMAHRSKLAELPITSREVAVREGKIKLEEDKFKKALKEGNEQKLNNFVSMIKKGDIYVTESQKRNLDNYMQKRMEKKEKELEDLQARITGYKILSSRTVREELPDVKKEAKDIVKGRTRDERIREFKDFEKKYPELAKQVSKFPEIKTIKKARKNGGWEGEPRRHAKAAKKGWQKRRKKRIRWI